jgi:hypothetical protein
VIAGTQLGGCFRANPIRAVIMILSRGGPRVQTVIYRRGGGVDEEKNLQIFGAWPTVKEKSSRGKGRANLKTALNPIVFKVLQSI